MRLNAMVDGRKRFDGVIDAVDGETIVFALIDGEPAAKPARATKKLLKPKQAGAVAESVKLIRVPFASIDKTRLIPDI